MSWARPNTLRSQPPSARTTSLSRAIGQPGITSGNNKASEACAALNAFYSRMPKSVSSFVTPAHTFLHGCAAVTGSALLACGMSCRFPFPEKPTKTSATAARRTSTSLYPKQLDGTAGDLYRVTQPILVTDVACRLFAPRYPLALEVDRQHQAVGKETGLTNHVERFNNTIRQRAARFVRETLSFSKADKMHLTCLHLFLYRYNLERAAVTRW